MSPERWKEIERVFNSVLAREPTERSAVLEQSCGEDVDLRREVQLLLAAQDEAGSFLETGGPVLARLQAPPASVLQAAGRMLGQYQISSPLGAGAMGEVYLAHDTRLDRRVAVKILPARFTGERARVARFMLEAKASSALNHPNIVTVYDGGEDRGVWYIATEFIDGVTLRHRINEGKLPISEALDIAIQCGVALDAAHSAGVLHRDIKPENIMIRRDKVVKVVDFGLALIMGSGWDSGISETQTGAVLGTPRYMSPEQARGEKLDATADLFSMGAVLYEMVTGNPAFPGSSTAEVLTALFRSDPPPPSSARKGLPSAFDAISAKALAKNRSSRYRTAKDFVTDLRALKQKLDLRQAQEDLKARGRLRNAAIAAGTLVAIAAAGAFWYQRLATLSREEPLPPAVPLTSFEGSKEFPALSHDGKKVAFSWNGGQGGFGGKQERNIYIMPVGGGDPVQLTYSRNDQVWPAWSHNGRFIAFGRPIMEPSRDTFIMPSNGGPERWISRGGNGVSWSPDDKMLALSRRGWPTESGAIFLFDLQTGQQRDVTTPKPDSDSRPVFSPDGRWIAFCRGPSPMRQGVWVVPSQGGTARQLTANDKRLLGLTWTADSRDVVFATERYRDGLWRVSIAGGEPRHLPVSSNSASNPTISGSRLVYTESFVDTNIYKHDGPGFEGGPAPRPFGPERPFVLSSREDDSPRFSPDGKRVVFSSSRSGYLELWTMPESGGQPSPLTHLRSLVMGSPRWSPDGSQIAFDMQYADNVDVYVTSSKGGPPRRLTSDKSPDIMPSWSPDGKWIYFTSERSGNQQIWRMPATGGPAIQITHGGAREGSPSPDGNLIYFTRKRPEAALWSAPAKGGLEEPVAELKQFDRIARGWGVVREGIYFISREEGTRQTVRFFSFATRHVSPLLALDKEPIWRVPCLALSPDGKMLLTVYLDQQVNDLMMVEGFH